MLKYHYYLIICFLVFPLVILTSSTAFSVTVFKYKYEGVEMMVKGTVSQKYSDNFRFEVEDQADASYFTTLGLDAELKYEGKRQSLNLRGKINYWFDTEEFDDERVSENLSLEYHRDLSKYHRLSLSDRFSHTRFPISFEEEFGRTGAKLDDYKNIFTLSYSRDISEDITIATDYSNFLYWTSKEEVSRDSVQHKTGFNVGYTYSPATSIRLSYSYSISEFEEADEISFHSVSTGLSRVITERLHLDVSIGWSFTSAEEDSFTLSVSLANEIDEKSDASLLFSRSIRTSHEGDVFRSWEISGEIDRKLLEGLNGSLSGFYGEGEFISAGREDKFLGISANINYIINRYLSAGVSYTLSHLDSNIESREYMRNTISVGASLTF
jgi:hypothetical protein